MRTIKTGIASFGMSGMVFHAPLLNAHRGFEISGILERRSRRSEKFYPGIRIFTSFDELLADHQTEMVVINTPDHLHHEMALQALQAGKHVVVEKPFTQDAAQAEELIRKASERQLLLSVFQNRRWDGDFMTVREVIGKQMLGRLVEYEAHFDRYRNFIKKETWKESAKTGTGTLYNLGSHLIDQALVLFGMPVSVTADLRKQRADSEVDDAFTLWLNYPHIKVTLKAGYLARLPVPRYILHGTHGSYHKSGIDPQEGQLKEGILPGAAGWGAEAESDWGIIDTEIDGIHMRGKIETTPGNYLNYYENIYRAVVRGEDLAVTAEQARDVVRIIEAAYESQSKQKAILL